MPKNGLGDDCAGIIKRHGGKIWAESSPGLGATFHFTLGVSEETTPSVDEP